MVGDVLNTGANLKRLKQAHLLEQYDPEDVHILVREDSIHYTHTSFKDVHKT